MILKAVDDFRMERKTNLQVAIQVMIVQDLHAVCRAGEETGLQSVSFWNTTATTHLTKARFRTFQRFHEWYIQSFSTIIDIAL
jgi:hypothetical protein